MVRLIYAYQTLGDEEKARQLEATYSQLRSSTSIRAHFNRGLKAYSEKRYAVAVHEFQKVLEANPRNASVRTNLGYIYLDQQRLEQALEQFNQALLHDPNHANAHYGIALTYAAQGDPKKAIAHFQQYVSLEPSGHYSRTAKNKIRQLSSTPSR